MKKLAAVLSVLGMVVLAGACTSEVGDSEEDAVQQDEAMASASQDDATASQDDKVGSASQDLRCRRVCHTRRGRRVCTRVCRHR